MNKYYDKHFDEIKESPFGNTYGGLSLVKCIENNEKYLTMEDCFGKTFFGPCSKEQELAFYILCEIKEIIK